MTACNHDIPAALLSTCESPLCPATVLAINIERQASPLAEKPETLALTGH